MNKLITINEFFDVNSLPNAEQNLGMKRVSMPQIDTDKFLKAIDRNKDITYAYGDEDTNNLMPTQDQFNSDKVKAIVLGLRSGNTPKPIIVSNDNYVVDGHHRWAAHNNIGTPIPIIKVGHNIDDLLAYLADKSYVVNKTINEDTNKYNGISEIANMKRQLIDLLRIRVQKGYSKNDKEHSKALSDATDKLNSYTAKQIKASYNTEVINNQLTPIGKNNE